MPHSYEIEHLKKMIEKLKAENKKLKQEISRLKSAGYKDDSPHGDGDYSWEAYNTPGAWDFEND